MHIYEAPMEDFLAKIVFASGTIKIVKSEKIKNWDILLWRPFGLEMCHNVENTSLEITIEGPCNHFRRTQNWAATALLHQHSLWQYRKGFHIFEYH